MVGKNRDGNSTQSESVFPSGRVQRDSAGSRSPGVQRVSLSPDGRFLLIDDPGTEAAVAEKAGRRSFHRAGSRAVKISVGFAVLLVLIAVGAYRVWTDGYRVESELLFFKAEPSASDRPTRPLGKEIEILKSSGLRSYLAAGLYDSLREGGTWSGSSDDAFQSAILRDGLARYADRAQFEQWLSESFRAVGSVSDGVAKVQVTLDGDDPDFLKALMEAYIRRYMDHRNEWAPEGNDRMRLASVESRTARIPSRLSEMDDRIHELTMNRSEVEIALKHLDSGKGTFKGFVPVSQGAGTIYLQRFQDKLVELEIKKRSMAAHFTDQSGEMRAVSQEIKAIQEGMREALKSHLVFLNRKVEGMQARRAELSKTCGPVREIETSNGAGKPCSGRPNGHESWYFASDGLYIVTDRPSTVHRPVTATAKGFGRTLYAYFRSPAPSTATAALAKASVTTSVCSAPTGCVTIDGLHVSRPGVQGVRKNSGSHGETVAPHPRMAGPFQMVSAESSETGSAAKKGAPWK
ncbi:MAG: hypothetical protein RDU20_22660 [Desulfomonilaceae bacterium]|nr:hypothetical protein [Desulfomonilaceae bacterium]